MPLYTHPEQVKVRLQGKVKFTSDPEEQNKLSEGLLRRLINEAEADVEFDLSLRYEVPLKSKTTGDFSGLPDRPTKEIIRTLCELKSVIRVLETDFGRGSAMNGDKYTDSLEKRYQNILERVMKRRKEDEYTNQWLFPPLPDLKLNGHNTEADDGFFGMVMTTSDGVGDFPKHQINDPSLNYNNAVITDDELR